MGGRVVSRVNDFTLCHCFADSFIISVKMAARPCFGRLSVVNFSGFDLFGHNNISHLAQTCFFQGLYFCVTTSS